MQAHNVTALLKVNYLTFVLENVVIKLLFRYVLNSCEPDNYNKSYLCAFQCESLVVSSKAESAAT